MKKNGVVSDELSHVRCLLAVIDKTSWRTRLYQVEERQVHCLHIVDECLGEWAHPPLAVVGVATRRGGERYEGVLVEVRLHLLQAGHGQCRRPKCLNLSTDKESPRIVNIGKPPRPDHLLSTGIVPASVEKDECDIAGHAVDERLNRNQVRSQLLAMLIEVDRHDVVLTVDLHAVARKVEETDRCLFGLERLDKAGSRCRHLIESGILECGHIEV